MNGATAGTINKAEWGPGQWQQEPDFIEWRACGLPCLMVRHSEAGHWCGYVAVPPGHPLHGRDYGDSDTQIDVHGGLTYSGACEGKVCHVPGPGEPDDVWWLGFDCAHWADLSPGRAALYGGMGIERDVVEQYRDAVWVQRETERLARQLAEMVP